MNNFERITGKMKNLNTGIMIAGGIVVLVGLLTIFTPLSLPGQEGAVASSSTAGGHEGWAFLAAGLSISVSVLGAGIALSRIGSSAMAALAEKPEIMGSAIVFAGLAEGLSIWGLIVAVLILGKI